MPPPYHAQVAEERSLDAPLPRRRRLGREMPDSARLEHDQRDVALRAGLIFVVVWPLRGHDRPQPLFLGGRRGARPNRNDLVAHLNFYVRMGEQILVPA